MRIETWPIERIVVGQRVRQKIGNLKKLKGSMTEVGLINPITVREDRVLLAGARRLRAAIELGWQEVDVHVWRPTDGLEALAVEGEENLCREPLTPGEADQYWVQIRELIAAEAKARQVAGAQHASQIAAAKRHGDDLGAAMDTGTEEGKPKRRNRTKDQAKKVTGHSATSLLLVEKVRKLATDPTQTQETRDEAERQYTYLTEGTTPVKTAYNTVLATIQHPATEVPIAAQPPASPEKLPRNVPREQRLEQIRELAAKDLSSKQISERIGLGASTIREYAKKAGIEIHADKFVLRMPGPRPSNEIVAKLALEVEVLGEHIFDYIHFDELNKEEIPEWIRMFESGRKQISQFITKLKELQ